MSQHLNVMIMAGGSGTRFWPRSRRNRPKQLIEIAGDGTMVQQTVRRLRPAVSEDRILVITNRNHVAETRRQLPELPPDAVVGEPCGRDTAACVALGAALIARRVSAEAMMVVLSADHVIDPPAEFQRTLAAAAVLAESAHALITFGVKPRGPSTLFGYIHRGERLAASEDIACPAYRVEAFREKPDAETAAEYVASGEYYWNSGMFVWRVADIQHALRSFMPELQEGIERIADAFGTPAEAEVMAQVYPQLERTSIDYAVMEKAPNRAVIEVNYDWNDVGSWEAAASLHGADGDGNTLLAEHVGLDTSGCILAAEPGHLVATIGVSGLVIVQTPEATLICDRERVADVKALVARLEALKRTDIL